MKVNLNESLFDMMKYTPLYGMGKSETITIYKNPTSSEWREIESNARGVIDLDGDLYMCSSDKVGKYTASSIIHLDILHILGYNHITADNHDQYNEYLLIQRDRKSKDLYLSESYVVNVPDDDIVEMYFDICKKKNELVTFKNERI